jgi:hypothetical protein
MLASNCPLQDDHIRRTTFYHGTLIEKWRKQVTGFVIKPTVYINNHGIVVYNKRLQISNIYYLATTSFVRTLSCGGSHLEFWIGTKRFYIIWSYIKKYFFIVTLGPSWYHRYSSSQKPHTGLWRQCYMDDCLMMFNATFNNISIISRRSVLLAELRTEHNIWNVQYGISSISVKWNA